MMHTKNDLILHIECQLKSFYCKRRFSATEWTLGDFCSYLEQLLSISKENLILLLHEKQLDLEDHHRRLGDLGYLSSHDRIVVESRRPIDDIDDINRLQEKYRMSNEVYSQRRGTLREYLQVNQLGPYNTYSQSLAQSINRSRQRLRASNQIKLKQIDIGMRVLVNEPINASKSGEVIYIGTIRGMHDEFVGVHFDGPWGDSNGCDGTIQYFEAKQKHASFVRPEYIVILSAP